MEIEDFLKKYADTEKYITAFGTDYIVVYTKHYQEVDKIHFDGAGCIAFDLLADAICNSVR